MGVGAMLGVLLLVLAISLVALPPSGDGPAGGRDTSAAGSSVITQPAQLSALQRDNARMIIEIAQRAGAKRNAVIITLMAAMQESSLHNLPYGDRDSLGFFQQRPSQGWGTPAEVRDPVHATEAFLGVGDRTPNPGLMQIRGWERMSKNDAAQAVQRSDYPDLYGRWEPLAKNLWMEFRSAE